MVLSQRQDHVTYLAVWFRLIVFPLLTFLDQQLFKTTTLGFILYAVRLISYAGEYVISTNLIP